MIDARASSALRARGAELWALLPAGLTRGVCLVGADNSKSRSAGCATEMGFFLPEVSRALCGLALPGQGVFWGCACLAAAVGELLVHLPCRAPAPSPVSHCFKGFGVPSEQWG